MSAGRRNGRPNRRVDASLYGEISDAEMLAVVDDLADENGWTTTYDVRRQLGEDPWHSLKVPREDRGPVSGVGGRLGWLRRYGWLEGGEAVKVYAGEPEYGWRWEKSWRLTAMGHALLDNPKLARSVESALAGLNPAQRLRLAREIGESGAGAPTEIRAALRRQWQRSMNLRSS